MLKKTFLIAISSALALNAICQDITKDFRPNVANYSPNTAAFLRYGDQPVSKYTGVPSISVPFYTIKDGNFSLPIDLSYHAGGVRVEQEASWVGLGWSLNCGGQISRVVRGGYDDLGTNGFYKTPLPVKDPNAQDAQNPTMSSFNSIAINGTTTLYELFTQNYNIAPANSFDAPTQNDGEPDIFSFQAGQYSGKFIIDRPANSGESYRIRILSPDNTLKIRLLTSDNTFAIQTPDGVLYEYLVKDLQRDTPTDQLQVTGKDLLNQSFTYLTNKTKSYTTTWYLSKITLPNGRFISFSYTSEDIVSISRNQTLLMHGALNPDDPSPQPYGEYMGSQSPFTIIKSVTSQKLVSTITFGNLLVTFNKTSDRIDIQASSGMTPGRLTGIDVFYKTSRVKGIALTQDYFSSGTFRSDLYSKRLRLKEVAETDGTNTLRPYRFGYQSKIEGVLKNLPDKDSFNQDYWGFYNGKSNDSNPVIFLAPRLKEFYVQGLYPGYKDDKEFKFSDRTVDARYAVIGTINEIDYPTGGATKFVFESNDFSNLPSITSTNVNGLSAIVGPPVGYNISGPPESVNNNLSGGGIRVKKVLTYDCGSDKVKETRYDYINSAGKSSGKLMFPFAFYGTDEEGYTFSPAPGHTGGPNGKRIMTRLSSNSNYSLGNSAQGAAVGYSSVKEYVNGALFEIDYFENLTEKQYSSFYFGTSYPVSLRYFPNSYAYQNSPDVITGIANSSIAQVFFSHSGIPNVTNYSNGTLLNKTLYKTVNNLPVMIHESISGYVKTQVGFSEGLVARYYSPSGTNQGQTYLAFFYKIPVVTNLLSTQTENDYKDNGAVITSTVNYTHNADYQVSSVQTLNSKSQTLLTKTFYPHDVIAAPADFAGQSVPVYTQMVDVNHIAEPVRQQRFLDGVLTNSVDFFYQNVPPPTGITTSFNYQPYTVKEYSRQNLTAQTEYQYDSWGNVTGTKVNGGKISAYLWNYDKLYPVAAGSGADVADIAYTNFENLIDDGGWTRTSGSTVLPSGGLLGSVSLNGSVTRSLNPAITYEVSVWSLNGQVVTVNGVAPSLQFTKGNFSLYTKTVSGVSAITVAGQNLDEIRLAPSGSQLTTFSFDPYIGMRYQIDSKNQLTSYNYDSFNRLATVYDQDKNIVKANAYNYSNSPTCQLYISNGVTKSVFPQCSINYSARPVMVTVPDGIGYSLISQEDADSKNDAVAQSLANSQGVCLPTLTINYIQKNGGTTITLNFAMPNGATNYAIQYMDISYHTYTGTIPVSTTTPTVTLPAAGRTYLITVTANYNGNSISGGRNFTFEATANHEKSQVFVRAGCTSGCNVTYTVPAGRYYADTQTLADQMAQDDIDANGQANADRHY